MCVKHRRLFLWRIAKPHTLQMSVRYFVISLLFCSITTKFAYHQASKYFPRKWKNKIKSCPHAKKLFVNLQLFEGDPLPLRQRHNITYVPNTILFQIHFSLVLLRRWEDSVLKKLSLSSTKLKFDMFASLYNVYARLLSS